MFRTLAPLRTTTTAATVPTRLVAADGMLMPDDWGRLGLESKEGWLASLDLAHVRAQASVIAVAGRQSVDAVLMAWAQLGLIAPERAAAALAVEIPA